MTNITLALPDEVHQRMKSFPDMRWSEVARQAIVEKIDKLELAEKFAKKSRLSLKDAEEFSRFLKKKAMKKYLENIMDK